MPPALFTSSAARKLPRPALFALLLLYALPGLFARDPWKTDDASGFGLMLTMARGTWNDWLMPNVMGIPVTEEGPLFFWLGGLSIHLFGGWIGELLASRVVIFGAIFLLCWSVWHATFALARRPEAQPHDPIGETTPHPVSYGRVVADAAMLILLATLGLIGRLHETTAEVGAIACIALCLYSLSSALHRPRKGALLFSLGLAGAILTRGLPTGLPILLAAVMAFALCKPLRFNLRIFSVITLPVCLLLLACWPILLWQQGAAGQAYLTHWWQWNLNQFGWAGSSLRLSARTLLWYAWPAWPIALWSLWSLRQNWHLSWRTPHILLPLAFILSGTLYLTSLQRPLDTDLLPLLPGLVVLAALGLTRLKRGAVNAIDWFSVMAFSLLCTAFWFYWIASMTGIPARAAHSIARLAPGFQPTFVWGEFLFAVAVTLGWGWLIYWRISRRPRVLWRSVVLSSGGLVLTWALLTTLWMPWLNHTRTYRDVAWQLKAHLPAQHGCIETRYLGLAQRATLGYFSDLTFIDATPQQPIPCRYLLLQDSVANLRDARLPDRSWTLRWEGRRAANRDERFRLYQRTPRTP